ncbi:MAG: glycosyltransferase family 4 protein [Candidatus Moranbacteria bacterium]|jgi:glycosyltransferase involved in cell wall biosynthesis|nr:glycosyltransferase family 4 protein [Candidatus Moranbacteria bacterium]
MILNTYLTFIKDSFLNIFLSKNYDLFYVVENANWSTDWDGKYIVDNLNKQKLIRSRITTTTFGLRNKILHFGSVNTFISENGPKIIHPSNKIILTWFHVSPNDPRIKYIPELNTKAQAIHTSCNLTKNKLIQLGLEEEKIIVIPLGVDLSIFQPCTSSEKLKIRKELGLPQNKIIIGSFQKDGNGWKEGLTPKMIKGPDIFCDIIERLAERLPIYALLTGPARGYVKKRLENAHIPYKHKFLKNYPDIINFYKALDLYLVTSRAEGGPKALLESMACGIPIISTSVGMTPDIIIDLQNGIIIDTDIKNSTEKIISLIEDNEKLEKILKKEIEAIKKFNWEKIAIEYFEKIYEK